MYYNPNRQERMGMHIGDTHLIEDIIKSLIAEVHCYYYYERLAQLANNEQNRQIILRIQHDEAKHYHWFSMILRMMGVDQPQIPSGDLPNNFKDGVREAIGTELDAAAFYQDIAYRATEHPVQMHFMHASNDEQRHAAYFQNMLVNL